MNYSEKRKMILEGDLKKIIILLAAPIMLNNFIQTIYNLTDTYWVSKLGSTEIAAMALVWPVVFFMIALGMGISVACSSLISQYIGADNIKDAEKVSGQAVIFSLGFSIILGVIGYIIAPYVLTFMNAEGELFEKALSFVRIMFCGLPTMFLMFSFNSIKQGQGDTKAPMVFGFISVSINIILDPIMIFGLNMGIQGAAIATVLARGIVSVYALYTLFNSKQGIKLRIKNLRFHSEVLEKLIVTGIPASIGQSMSALGFIVLNIFIVSYGEQTLAAFSIGNRINSLVLMPAMGVGSALATVVGQNLGADYIERAKKAVKTSFILNTIFMVIGGIIIYIIAENCVRIFAGDDALVIEQGTFYLKLICLTLPLVGYFQIFNGIFQGSGHTGMSMIMMAGRLWGLRIPLIWYLKRFESLGEHAIWYSMILSNFIICLIGLSMYLSGHWQKKIIKIKDRKLAKGEV